MSTAPKFTPGPLEVNDVRILRQARDTDEDAIDRLVALVYSNTPAGNNMKANAFLFAAAPELYEALAKARHELSGLNVRPDGEQKLGHAATVIAVIDAALAKVDAP